MPSCLPIKDDDATITKALEEAHLPSLIAALVHVTGDASPIRGDIKPVYDFFGDGQGSLTPEQRERVKTQALTALKAFAAGGSKMPPQPAGDVIRELMDFVAGAKIPEHYVPFLMEELALSGEDPKAGHWGEAIPAGVKKDFRVLMIGAGMSGVLAAIRLKQAGIPFTIVDKNSEVGGTWFENTYPGCRVDNPNHLYSYSFEPNYDWPQHYSTQGKAPRLFPRRRGEIRHPRARELRHGSRANRSTTKRARMWSSRLRHKDGREETVEVERDHQRSRPAQPSEDTRTSKASTVSKASHSIPDDGIIPSTSRANAWP